MNKLLSTDVLNVCVCTVTEEAVSSPSKLIGEFIGVQVFCQVLNSAIRRLCTACRIEGTEVGFLSPSYLVKIWQLMALSVLKSINFFFLIEYP